MGEEWNARRQKRPEELLFSTRTQMARIGNRIRKKFAYEAEVKGQEEEKKCREKRKDRKLRKQTRFPF